MVTPKADKMKVQPNVCTTSATSSSVSSRGKTGVVDCSDISIIDAVISIVVVDSIVPNVGSEAQLWVLQSLCLKSGHC